MIEPNFDLLIWMVLISWILHGTLRIANGAIGAEKETKFGAIDVIVGVVTLICAVLVLSWH